MIIILKEEINNNLEENNKENNEENNDFKEATQDDCLDSDDNNFVADTQKIFTPKPVEEKLICALLVCFISGFLDSYTYVLFDQIFANTQTGNLIFFAIHLVEGDYMDAIYRLAPILSFSLAIFITQFLIRFVVKDGQDSRKLVKSVILINVILTILVGLGLFGQNDYFTNPNTQLGRSNLAIISSVCFMCGSILSIFKKTDSYVYAPIMFTGNIRALAETFSRFLLYKDKQEFKNFLLYLLLIIIFCGGVAIGLVAVKAFEFNSIYFVTILFLITYGVVSKKD